MTHNPDHTMILCFRDGEYTWECEDCLHTEPAKRGKFKVPEETHKLQLLLVAA